MSELDQVITRINNVSDNITEMDANYSERIRRIESAIALNHSAHEQKHVEYKNTVESYMKNRMVNLEQKKYYGIEKEELGGALIAPELSDHIQTSISKRSVIRNLAGCVNISSSSFHQIVQDEKDEFTVAWAPESEARQPTKTSKFRVVHIPVNDVYACVQISQNLISDARVDIVEFVTSSLVDAFASEEEKAFLFGDGQHKPNGIIAQLKGHKNQEQKCMVSTTDQYVVTYDDIINMISSLQGHYQSKASFVMHSSTLINLRSIKDKNGRFIYQPSFDKKDQETIFGIPVYTSDSMPTIDLAKKERRCVVLYGDFQRAYRIVQHKDTTFIQDQISTPPFVKIHATRRVGGSVIDFSSIRGMEC